MLQLRLKFNFFRIYEFLLYQPGNYSIGMWSIQTILSGDTLYNYLSKIPGIEQFSFVSGDGGINAIIYSIQTTTSIIIIRFYIFQEMLDLHGNREALLFISV